MMRYAAYKDHGNALEYLCSAQLSLIIELLVTPAQIIRLPLMDWSAALFNHRRTHNVSHLMNCS